METAITLSGMLGADPEVQTTTSSVKARFRVAVTRRELRDGRWSDVDTTWMQVEAWNLLARNVATSLRKGDPVVVSGVLRTSRWTDERGTRHDRIYVTAHHVGHDLALGCSEFQRAVRTGDGSQPDGTQTDGAWSDESAAGQISPGTISAATGSSIPGGDQPVSEPADAEAA